MRYTKKVLKKEDGVRPSGGIGRRTGLKILRDLTLVPVQVRPRAPFLCLSGGIGRRTGLKILRESTLVPVQVRP